MRKLLVTFHLFLLAFAQSNAQSYGGEWGIGLGASIYQGDLSPYWYGAYNRPGFTFQFAAQKNLLPGLAIRGNFAHGSISDNEDSYTSGVHMQRNFSFNARYSEFSALLVINPMFNYGEEEAGNLRPYFFGGAGVALTRIQRDFSRFNWNFPYWQAWVRPGLRTDSMTKLPTSITTFPVGVGLRYQIGDNIALFGEATKRITSTEYLDGFSKSANRKERDGFSSIVFGLSFRLGDEGYGDGSGGLFGGRGIFGGLFGGGGNGRNRGSVACPKNVF